MNITTQNNKRHGFTLIELLVVIAIISVLVALLLPAVQSARSAARRTQNRNNLKQIGIALHSYHELQRQLPSGWIGVDEDGEHDIESGNGIGWGTMILPMMDQTNIYTQFDFTASIDDPANQTARETYMGMYRSPQDNGPKYWEMESEDPGDPNPNLPFLLPTSNYIGVFGTTELHDCHGLAVGEQCESDGAFFHNSQTRFAHFHDGLSNTYIIGERKTDEDKGWYSTWVGAVPEGEEHLARILGAADHTPNHPDAHFEDFSSWDAVGVFFLYGDGHVGFVNESIREDIFQGLSTLHGHEPFSAPSY